MISLYLITLVVLPALFVIILWILNKNNQYEKEYRRSAGDISCKRDPSKTCPVHDDMTIEGPGILRVPSEAWVQCCEFERQCKAATKIMKVMREEK